MNMLGLYFFFKFFIKAKCSVDVQFSDVHYICMSYRILRKRKVWVFETVYLPENSPIISRTIQVSQYCALTYRTDPYTYQSPVHWPGFTAQYMYQPSDCICIFLADLFLMAWCLTRNRRVLPAPCQIQPSTNLHCLKILHSSNPG